MKEDGNLEGKKIMFFYSSSVLWVLLAKYFIQVVCSRERTIKVLPWHEAIQHQYWLSSEVSHCTCWYINKWLKWPVIKVVYIPALTRFMVIGGFRDIDLHLLSRDTITDYSGHGLFRWHPLNTLTSGLSLGPKPCRPHYLMLPSCVACYLWHAKPTRCVGIQQGKRLVKNQQSHNNNNNTSSNSQMVSDSGLNHL